MIRIVSVNPMIAVINLIFPNKSLKINKFKSVKDQRNLIFTQKNDKSVIINIQI